MAKEKSFTLEDIHMLLNNLNYDKSLINENLITNTLIPITCKVNPNHIYKISLTQIRNGEDPAICTHCRTEARYALQGLQEQEVQEYCNRNNLDYEPKQKTYKKWANDYITFTCKKCNEYKFTIKSINNWCKGEGNNGINRTLNCPICEKNRLGLLTPEDFEKKIDSIKYNAVPIQSTIDIQNDFSLPESLTAKIISQNKWKLIKYINTKNKASYQCNDCGYVKEIYPHNLFVGRNFGCESCRRTHDKVGVVEKLKGLMTASNVLPLDPSVFVDSTTPIKFKCNECGHEFERIWQHINAYDKIPCPNCYVSKKRKAQNELCEWVKTVYTGEVLQEQTINGIEIDIYIPDKKVAIEYCGMIWHSTKYKKNKDSHKNKYVICKTAGIRLLTIFEDEWLIKNDICKSRIMNTLGVINEKIYGRDLVCKSIATTDAVNFCKDNHIQGGGTCSFAYGLYHSEELVSVMTFSIPSIAKHASSEYNYELNRFCSKKYVVIHGAANKLFSKVKEDYKGVKIYTFSDLRWNNGNVYEQMGFTLLGITRPNYYYVGQSTNWVRKHRYTYAKHKLLEMFRDSDPSKTEEQIAEDNGLYQVFDCGHLKYEITL